MESGSSCSSAVEKCVLKHFAWSGRPILRRVTRTVRLKMCAFNMPEYAFFLIMGRAKRPIIRKKAYSGILNAHILSRTVRVTLRSMGRPDHAKCFSTHFSTAELHDDPLSIHPPRPDTLQDQCSIAAHESDQFTFARGMMPEREFQREGLCSTRAPKRRTPRRGNTRDCGPAHGPCLLYTSD